MPPNKDNRKKRKQLPKFPPEQAGNAKESRITSSNNPVISVPSNISVLNSEGYHHVLSDIYDYFENQSSFWDYGIRFFDIVLGIGGTGIVSYFVTNNITQSTSFIEVWRNIRLFVVLIATSIIFYIIEAMVKKRGKQKGKDEFFSKFEHASQIVTIPIETQISPVPSTNAQSMNTGNM